MNTDLKAALFKYRPDLKLGITDIEDCELHHMFHAKYGHLICNNVSVDLVINALSMNNDRQRKKLENALSFKELHKLEVINRGLNVEIDNSVILTSEFHHWYHSNIDYVDEENFLKSNGIPIRLNCREDYFFCEKIYYGKNETPVNEMVFDKEDPFFSLEQIYCEYLKIPHDQTLMTILEHSFNFIKNEVTKGLEFIQKK